MQSKTFSFIILFVLIISCTSSPKKSTRPLTRRQRQLLYYQKLRQSQWEKITRKSGHHKDSKVTIKPRQERSLAPKRKSKPAPSKPRVIAVDPHEQRIEMEQLISFHCMKNRVENCDTISTQVFESCLEQYAPGDRNLTICVKRTLRNY